MERKHAHLWAGASALALYAVGYRVAWSFVWAVPAGDRDGIEWIFVFLMTLPWSLSARDAGPWVVHAGAVVNGILFALLAASIVRAIGRARRPTRF